MNVEHFSNSHQLSSIRQPLVLAVDDNQDNLDLLTQLLLLNECSFITATDGQATISMAQNYQPNLILLDMMLPDLSGLEVVHLLKCNLQTNAIPIIAVTAMARAEDRERFLLAGCVDYVKKPYVIDELENTINRHLYGRNI